MRPTKLTDELAQKAKKYAKDGYLAVDEVIPTIAGLAVYLGVSRSTLYEYKKLNNEFSDTLEMILQNQERLLINRSLTGGFNATIAKLMLANHGYNDKQEVTNTTSLNMTNQEFEEIAKNLLAKI